MKSIQECFSDSQSLSEYIVRGRVDEGLKEFIDVLKTKFKQVVSVFGKLIARVGNYFASISEDGIILPVNAPVNLGVAYKNGDVNRSNTLVVLPPEEARIAKISTKITDAFKLYGSGNSLQYWKQLLSESKSDDSKLITENNYIDGEENYVKKFIEEFGDSSDNSKTINEVKLEADDPEAIYNRVVDEKELRDVIKEHINPNNKLARLLIWGAPGIGKTATLAAIVNEIKATSNKEYRCIVKTLSNETPDNFVLPKYTDDVEQMGDEDFTELAAKLNKPESWIKRTMKAFGSKATDIPKTWLPVYKPTGDRNLDAELDKRCGSGLLFIDELSRATPQVLNVILPLINEGNFNGYVLGSGWSIIAASNRNEDDMGQTELGTALSNRFAHVYFEPTVHSWRKWADNQGFISPLLLSWLSLPGTENISGGKFYYMDPNESNPENPTQLMCTPRSWTNAMRALAVYSHTGSLEGFSIFDIDDAVIKRVLNRYIPKTAIDSFMAFLDVVSKMGNNFDRSIDEIWKTGKTSMKITKRELGLVSLAIAQLIVTSHKDSLPTTDEFTNLATFIASTGSDQLAACMLDVFKNVYFANVKQDSAKDILFGVHRKIERIKRDPKVSANLQQYIDFYSSILKESGLGNLENFPDYSVGRSILVKKFGEIFANTSVNGLEALG